MPFHVKRQSGRDKVRKAAEAAFWLLIGFFGSLAVFAPPVSGASEVPVPQPTITTECEWTNTAADRGVWVCK